MLPFIFESLLNQLSQLMEQTKGTESRRPVAVGLDAVKKLRSVLVAMSSRGGEIKNAVIQEAMNIVADGTLADEDDDRSDVDSPEVDPDLYVPSDDTVQIDPEDSLPTEKEPDRKKSWWTDAYKQARTFLHGTKDTPPDLEQAFSLMQTEAETGNGFAMHDLGKMLLSGLGCDKDEEAAERWFEKALESFIQEEADTKNPAYLQYRIGKMYSFGYGVEQNHLQAAQWYEKAVAGKNIFAAYSLGSLYHRGQGVAQDEDRAYALFFMAANDSKKPNAYAAYTLGRMCREGVGTPASKEQSDSWYRRAYNGFLSMEETMADDKLYYRLGQMNLSGTGTETDLEKAEFYFRKAAELNNIDALYGLGKLYLKKSYEDYNPQKAVAYSAGALLSKISDNEQAFSGLGDTEILAVKHLPCDIIPQFIQRTEDRCKCPAFVM